MVLCWYLFLVLCFWYFEFGDMLGIFFWHIILYVDFGTVLLYYMEFSYLVLGLVL